MLDAESRAVVRSDHTRNGNRTSQRADRGHGSSGRATDGDGKSRGVELPSALSNGGCISDEKAGLGQHTGDIAGGDEEMAGAKRSVSVGGDAIKWCLPGSYDGCAVDEADGAVGSFLECNGDADVDDDLRTDTPGSTVSFSSWKSDVDEFMCPVGLSVGMLAPSPSVDLSNGVTSGDDDDSDSSSSAIAKSPLNRLVGPPSRKKPEGCEPLVGNLYDSLDRFVAEEELVAANGDGYNCGACSARTMSRSHKKVGKGRGEVDADRKKQDARKRLLLLGNPPKVLVCHLKRLQATKKISRKVKFDLEMDMSPYFWQDPQVYRDAFKKSYLASISRCTPLDLLLSDITTSSNACHTFVAFFSLRRNVRRHLTFRWKPATVFMALSNIRAVI